MESGKSITLTPEEIMFQKICGLVYMSAGSVQQSIINKGCAIFRKKMMTSRTTQDKIMLLTYTRELKRIPRVREFNYGLQRL